MKSPVCDHWRGGRLAACMALALWPSLPARAQDAVSEQPIAAPTVAAPLVLPTLTTAQAAQLSAMLDNAAAEGLPNGGNRAQQDDNAALISAALSHARALHAGRLESGDFLPKWGLKPTFYDPKPSFIDAVARDQLASWIAALPPPYVGYDNLRKALARYRRIQEDGGWPPLSAGPDLSLGATGPQVLELRRRLAIEDNEVATTGDSYDQLLFDAVRRTQRRYGINPTGTVAGQTRAALNVPVAARIRQIMANMERWRWLPASLPKDRVQVNIAAAVMSMFDGDTPVLSMRVVTGRTRDPTPMLQSRIHSIVINPPWNVPHSIAVKELWPKERRNHGYLRRNGFRSIAVPGTSRTRLQQAAGPKSALGRLKFDFDNPYAVYLHDTPTKSTFAQFARFASHGCVRLEKPRDFAQLLLADDPAWSADAIAAAIDAGKTRRVSLNTPMAVYLLYWTAFAGSNGQMNFRADPYGWDDILLDRINAKERV